MYPAQSVMSFAVRMYPHDLLASQQIRQQDLRSRYCKLSQLSSAATMFIANRPPALPPA